jgi:hypothetical protein
MYAPMGEESRWVLAGLYVDNKQVSFVSFTVSGPASVSAFWAKEYKVVVDCGQVACLEAGQPAGAVGKEGRQVLC